MRQQLAKHLDDSARHAFGRAVRGRRQRARDELIWLRLNCDGFGKRSAYIYAEA